MGQRNRLGRCTECGQYSCECSTTESHTLAVLRKLREKAGLVCDDTNHPADAVDIYNLIDEAIRNEGGEA